MQKTLILVNPAHQKTKIKKGYKNTEIDLFLKDNPQKKYDYLIYNKKTKKKFNLNAKSYLKAALKSCILWKKNDYKNLIFLLTQCKNYGFIETRYSGVFGSYIKYPSIIRYLFLFIYTRILSHIIDDYIKDYNELITVCYYDRTILPFVLSFRNQQKKVWDVQHGSITNHHFAYKKNCLTINSQFIPTGFIVYSEAVFQYFKWNFPRAFEIIKVKRSINKNINQRSQTPIILLSLQWASKVPIKVTNVIKRLQDSMVIIRMHPADQETINQKFCDESFLDYIKKNSFIIIENGSRPLLKTLSRVKLHITENSSVVHEASDFGVKSLFWCRQQAPLIFNEEVENKMAKLWDLRQDEKKLTLELVSFIK